MNTLDTYPSDEPASNLAFDHAETVIAGVRIDSISFDQAVETIVAYAQHSKESRFVVTPNAHHVVLFQKDALLRHIYSRALLVVADGVPLLWAARLLGSRLPERINGTDLFEALCVKAAELGLRVFLLGGREGAAEAAVTRLTARSPKLNVCGTYCPPVGFENDPIEKRRVLARINAAEPHLLFVGLGAPKQEYWMFNNRDRIAAPVSLGIGVSFELVGGVLPRAPRWMQRAGLEWFYRLTVEPKRLWKRYLVGNSLFCGLIAAQAIRDNVLALVKAQPKRVASTTSVAVPQFAKGEVAPGEGIDLRFEPSPRLIRELNADIDFDSAMDDVLLPN